MNRNLKTNKQTNNSNKKKEQLGFENFCVALALSFHHIDYINNVYPSDFSV